MCIHARALRNVLSDSVRSSIIHSRCISEEKFLVMPPEMSDVLHTKIRETDILSDAQKIQEAKLINRKMRSSKDLGK